MNAPEMNAPDMKATAAAGAARGLRVDPQVRADVEALYADAAAALDERRFDDWVDCFVDDCEYVVQPRENFDRGLPLATMMLESKGMLRDRIYAIGETLFHAPYQQRHVVGPIRVVAAEDGRLQAQASYAVFRTKVQQPSEVYNVGRTIDTVVRGDDGAWRFAARRVVFDSELIPNSIIYPI